MSAPTPLPSTPSTRPSTLNTRRSSVASITSINSASASASLASVLNSIAKHRSTDPELLLLQQRSRKCYAAHREQHWSSIDRWEQTRMQEEGMVVSETRGGLIDDWVSDLIDICAAAGFEIDDTQSLRDDVFDYVRSVSYR